MSRRSERVTVRSYRGVVDQVERRLYKFDRWRLPTPHGVSIRALIYTIAAFVAVALLSSLPVSGTLLGALPVSITWVALPLGAGWLLASWAPDGRAPHHALVSAVRHLFAPKHLSGLRKCPPHGAQLLGVAEIEVAPSGDEPEFRAGVIKGPATVAVRYAAKVELEGLPRFSRAEHPAELAGKAKTLRVRPIEGRRKPLRKATVIQVPAGREMRFE